MYLSFMLLVSFIVIKLFISQNNLSRLNPDKSNSVRLLQLQFNSFNVLHTYNSIKEQSEQSKWDNLYSETSIFPKDISLHYK